MKILERKFKRGLNSEKKGNEDMKTNYIESRRKSRNGRVKKKNIRLPCNLRHHCY
ncbi:hypothetical protein BKA69DRAFT_1051734 [Paraphysoderma sedebokerense]|nr:hypothetical protein BKA69DRAFT_1051734 [Paraphysoderma sedebokerense]